MGNHIIHLIIACNLLAFNIINLWMWSIMTASNNWTLLVSTNAYGEHDIEMAMFIFSAVLSLIAIYWIYKEASQ